MKKLKSLKLNREFYLDESRTEPFEGLPCFNHKEIALLKTRLVADEELGFIFDAKCELGATLEEIYTLKPPKLTPQEEIGYKRKETRPNEIKRDPVKGQLIADWAARIKETIASKNLKGIKPARDGSG